eukprot:5157763-Alexandrium_andersonii.AAC.1
MCFSTQAVRTARAAGPNRHTTSCPAATQVPSPASRVLRPHLQRETGNLCLSSWNPIALIRPNAASRSSSNQR